MSHVIAGVDPLCGEIVRALGFNDELVRNLTLRLDAGDLVEVTVTLLIEEFQGAALREVLRRYRLCLEELVPGEYP